MCVRYGRKLTVLTVILNGDYGLRKVRCDNWDTLLDSPLDHFVRAATESIVPLNSLPQPPSKGVLDGFALARVILGYNVK